MAGRLMRFCYCGECEAVVEETVTMVRWFESDFCNTKCLNKFIRKNATACHECRKELAAHPIHAIKSINATAAEPHSVESMVDGQPTLAFASAPLFATKYFCSADCLRAHKVKAVMCEYCLKPTVAKAKATSGAGAVEAGGHRNVAFCSEECRLLMQMSYNNHRLFVGVCDNCAKKANITQRCLVDGIDYTMCSFGCRFEFENKNEVNLETCNQCTRHFANKNGAAFLILDLDCDVVFCGAKCMVRYLMSVERPSVCVQCSAIGNYYTMIRSAQNMTRRTWCSLDCALKEDSFQITEEQIIDLTLNKEAFFDRAQEVTDEKRLVVASILEESTEVSIVDDANTSKAPKTGQITSYSAEAIQPLTDAESKRLLDERQRSYLRQCQICAAAITNSAPFLRWHTMEFCNGRCFGAFVASKIGCVCWSCSSIIGANHLCVHVERIENELRLFCSEQCMGTYRASHKMCDHCGKVYASPRTCAEAAKRFCSVDCDRKFRRLYSQEVDGAVKPCTDCRRPKRVLVNFLHDANVFPYCSYACFFFLKFSCGIYADKCQMCTNYFVRRSTAAHTVRHDNMAHIFCSAICASHFMRKYRASVACTFCAYPNYDFYMVQLVSERGTNAKPFCSQSCLELFTETESAVLVEVGDMDEKKCQEFVEVMRMDKEHPVELPGMKEAADAQTQTEWPPDCNNNSSCETNKENIPRVKLIARKRHVNGRSVREDGMAGGRAMGKLVK